MEKGFMAERTGTWETEENRDNRANWQGRIDLGRLMWWTPRLAI
jgi:hypothetical protein